jgi:hypothetical protein
MNLKHITPLLLIVLIFLFSGCVKPVNDAAEDVKIGEKQAKNESEEGFSMDKISIFTDAFEEGGSIPVEYTCDGADVSPGLTWSGVPGAKSFVLIMDDPDAPVGVFTHWVIYNIPPDVTEFPKGVEKVEILEDGSLQGVNDFGKIGYNGPCPPPGKPHRYYFKIYALNERLSLKPGATKERLERAMQGHVLATGELMGRYGR